MSARAAVILTLALLPLAAPLRAETRIDTRTVTGGEKPRTTKTQVWIGEDRLTVRRDGAPRRIVFRADRGVLWWVDDARQTYFQIDPETSESYAGQVESLRQGVEAGVAKLPDDQREAVNDMLGDFLGEPSESGERPVARLSRGEGQQEIAGHTCDRYDVLEGEKRVAEICIAPLGPPGLEPEKLAAFRSLIVFAKEVAAPITDQVPALSSLDLVGLLGEHEGFPLEVQSQGGDTPAQTRVTGISEEAAPEGAFSFPDAYRRSWVPPL